MKAYLKYWLLFFSAILAGLAIIFSWFDKFGTYRWLLFWMHISGGIILWFLWFHQYRPIVRQILKNTLSSHSGKCLLFLLFLLAMISRFIFLRNYPFVGLGDELLDSGLNAMKIATGSQKQIFAFGSFQSHGLIIPTFSSFFFHIFGSTVYTYRFAAAFIAVLDILGVFFLIRSFTKNNLSAFLGAFALCALPVHLFYSRTELVVTFNSFLTTYLLVFFKLSRFDKKTIWYDLAWLGFIVGFSFSFHSTMRVFQFLMLLFIFVRFNYQLFKKKLNLIVYFCAGLLFLFFLMIGCGPHLKFMTFDNVFMTSRFYNTQENQKRNPGVTNNLYTRYVLSLGVWVIEPTNSWYPDKKPLLNPIIFGIFLLGILYSVWEKKRLPIALVFGMLLLHFTNSTITDMINADHRLTSLFPISALFIGIGVSLIWKKFSKFHLNLLLVIAIFFVLSVQLVHFFTNQSANLNKTVTQYLSMHAVYFLQTLPETSLPGCHYTFETSPKNAYDYSLLHYKQQYEYFLPNCKIETLSRTNFPDNKMVITSKNKRSSNQQILISCAKTGWFCPPKFNQNFEISYQ